MTALGIDLGGTKLSFAVFSADGKILHKHNELLNDRKGREVGDLIVEETRKIISAYPDIGSAGIAVPGIYYHMSGTVWAPNIPEWENYPLGDQLKKAVSIPVTIDSDRACYILGETWMGNAKGCRNAIYLAVGTGIGAGILVDGSVLRGAHDIGGAIGWMALDQPFDIKYIPCGCFEYSASGDGIARVAKELIGKGNNSKTILQEKYPTAITARDVFSAYEQKDPLATEVFHIAIRYWGMAIANLVSLFDPEKIILGGGVFGPAIQFISAIQEEAVKWAQPISMKKVIITASGLGSDAGLYGAGLLAFQKTNQSAYVR